MQRSETANYYCHSCQKHFDLQIQSEEQTPECIYCKSDSVELIEEENKQSQQQQNQGQPSQSQQDASNPQNWNSFSFSNNNGSVTIQTSFNVLNGNQPEGLNFLNMPFPNIPMFGDLDQLENQIVQMISLSDYGRVGPPKAADIIIESLEEFNMTEAQDCAVCKDSMQNQLVKKLPCDHIFHGDCVVPWLKQHNTCPVCRKDLPTEEEVLRGTQ